MLAVQDQARIGKKGFIIVPFRLEHVSEETTYFLRESMSEPSIRSLHLRTLEGEFDCKKNR